MHRIVILLLLIIFSFADSITSKTFIQNDTKKDNETEELEFLYVTAVNSTLLPTINSILETSELVQNLLHGVYMNDFHIFNFLESLQPSDCLQVCLDEVANMMEQPFAGQRSTDEVGNICSHFDVFQRCLHHKQVAKTRCLALLQRSSIISVPSIRMASKEKNAEVNILGGNDDKLLKVPSLYNLCSSSTCFISCTQNMAEKECSIGRSTLLHKIVATVVSRTTKMNPSPEVKSNDAYTLLVSSVLPNECQRLKLLLQDIILTTPMIDFVDDVKYDSGIDAMKQSTILNMFNESDLRSMEDEHILENSNAKYRNKSGFQDRKTITRKGKESTQASSNHLLPSHHYTFLLILLFQIY